MDPFGAATASWRERGERIVAEVFRRLRFYVINNPDIFPTVDSTSSILAAQSYIVQPPVATLAPDDANVMIASQVFGAAAGAGGGGGRELSFGTHFSGGPYDGTADATIVIDAVAANTASKIVARDGSGNFAAGTITAALTGNASTATSATTAGTVTAASQPAITSTGTLTTLVLGAGVSPSQQSGGANATVGTATLVAGTVVIATTAATANAGIFVQMITPGGTPGFLGWSKVVGTSFTLLSTSLTDTSFVSWRIAESH